MKRKDLLLKAFDVMKNHIDDLKVVTLCTIDGFPIVSQQFHNKHVDEAKLAAVASSITALSVASANQLVGSAFKSNTIETEDGMMLLVKTFSNQKECILCFVVSKGHKVGSVRYFALKLAKYITTI